RGIAGKAAMSAADRQERHHHGNRSRRHRLRALALVISHRSCAHRAPALRPSSVPGRTRPQAAAGGERHRRRRGRHLRRADHDAQPDLEDLLWSAVNLFPRAADRVQRDLDDNEDAQKRSQKEQDGSEIRSVELERLVAEGLTLVERRNSVELFRDLAADQFERHTGSTWRPRSGSMVNHRTLTAAMVDSRDFLAAKRRAETEVLLPAGPKIAFTGGLDFNDHAAIWDTLDKVHAKHPDMVLLHGGSSKGAERIAACWADNRKVTQVVFKPDWNRHARAAPFKRNDRILDVLPIGVIVFPGSGISANLADKAKKLGIPIWKYGGA